MYWLTTLAVILVAAASWLYWRRRNYRLLQLASMLPGPPALPLLGNALIFMAKPEEILNIIGRLLDTYGQYVKFWLGPELNIVVKNPEDIRLLLTSKKINQKGPLYEFLKSFIGTGILSGGPTWRHFRKIVTPSYNKKSVHQYMGIFNGEGLELAQRLIRKHTGTKFNIYFDVVDCTTQCVCQTLMGLSKEESQTVDCMNEVVRDTQLVYNIMFTKMTHWWLHVPLIYWLSGMWSKERYFRRLIDRMCSDIIAKRRRTLQNEVTDSEVASIVDRCIFSKEMSDEEMKFETFALFSTSQEASAKITSAVLLFLAHLPHWQEKVYNEIISEVGSEGFVSSEQIKRLKYLDMVYKEALRYMSIAAFIQRTVEEEVSICNGTITLPVGASVVIPIHMLHRDPQYWEEPHKVKPERFQPENCKERDPNAFVPFSLGAMDCLGRVFATALIKTLIVHVLRRVELLADAAEKLEDLELHVAISVKFAKGYNVRCRPRTQGNVTAGSY